jgi:hypothetical protein
MKVRSMKRPPVTWAIKTATDKERILCETCSLNGIRDYCPKFELVSIERERYVATRCTFYTTETTETP